MSLTGICVCGHGATFHHRNSDGIELCDYVGCCCQGWVATDVARDCSHCAHTFMIHKMGRCSSCPCTEYQTVVAIPIDQITELAHNADVIVVIVETDKVPDEGAYLAVPGTLYANAGLVLLQKGPGLYTVVRDEETWPGPADASGEEFASEQVIVEKLRALQRKLND